MMTLLLVHLTCFTHESTFSFFSLSSNILLSLFWRESNMVVLKLTPDSVQESLVVGFWNHLDCLGSNLGQLYASRQTHPTSHNITLALRPYSFSFCSYTPQNSTGLPIPLILLEHSWKWHVFDSLSCCVPTLCPLWGSLKLWAPLGTQVIDSAEKRHLAPFSLYCVHFSCACWDLGNDQKHSSCSANEGPLNF